MLRSACPRIDSEWIGTSSESIHTQIYTLNTNRWKFQVREDQVQRRFSKLARRQHLKIKDKSSSSHLNKCNKRFNNSSNSNLWSNCKEWIKPRHKNKRLKLAVTNSRWVQNSHLQRLTWSHLVQTQENLWEWNSQVCNNSMACSRDLHNLDQWQSSRNLARPHPLQDL